MKKLHNPLVGSALSDWIIRDDPEGNRQFFGIDRSTPPYRFSEEHAREECQRRAALSFPELMDEDEHRYSEGAAAAFGLMGMAFAIREADQRRKVAALFGPNPYFATLERDGKP